MPSLPELEVYQRQLSRDLAGRRVAAVEALDYRVVRVDIHQLAEHIVGKPVLGVHRYGKWLYFDFGAPEQLIIHLALTGKLAELPAADDPLPKYSAFAVHFQDWSRLVMSD